MSVPVVSFRLGLTDSEILAKEFYPEFSVEDLINLPNYNVYLKLMIEGRVSKPFSAETLNYRMFYKVALRSAVRHGRKRENNGDN
jgi:hypothetical protein